MSDELKIYEERALMFEIRNMAVAFTNSALRGGRPPTWPLAEEMVELAKRILQLTEIPPVPR